MAATRLFVAALTLLSVLAGAPTVAQDATSTRHLATPEPRASLEALTTELDQARRAGDVPLQAALLNDLGNLWRPGARSARPEALYLWQRQTGRLLAEAGQTDAAIAACGSAADTLAGIRPDLLLAEAQGGRPVLREAVEPVYVELADLLLQRAAGTPVREPAIGIRVGIHTGPLMVGNLGSERRMQYSVIGDAANTAARLESWNKDDPAQKRDGDYCRILVSEATSAHLDRRYRTELVGTLQLRGKQRPITVYRVVGGPDRPLPE